MAAVKRLQKELADIRKSSNLKYLKNLTVDESNILNWSGLILPNRPPYSKGAFRFELIFPPEYPFKPPKVVIKTRIYHPNIDENGAICLGLVTVENWKPATRSVQVIEAIYDLINNPEPDHSLRADLGEEFHRDNKKFMKHAEDFTKKHAEKRPPD